MLRRMSDLWHVLDIANNNAPESRLETLFKKLLINYHLKSMPHDAFNHEDATQRSISKDDKCSVIIFNNLLR